jgi:hypothetical protein
MSNDMSTTVRVSPKTLERLKALGVKYERRRGKIVEGLLCFAEQSQEKALLDKCLWGRICPNCGAGY